MHPLRDRRQRRALERWDHRRTLVFDERAPHAHRLTCLVHDLTDTRRLADFARIASDVITSNTPTVILDLRRVHDADSKLVSMLVQLARRARAYDVRMRVFPSESLESWFAVCRVEKFFRPSPDAEFPTHHLAS